MANRKRKKKQETRARDQIVGVATFDGLPGIRIVRSWRGYVLEIPSSGVAFLYGSPFECLHRAKLLVGAARADGIQVEQDLSRLEALVPARQAILISH